MVGNHHQDVAVTELGQNPPDHRVVVPVELRDRVLVRRRTGLARRGMAWLEVPPEHVLDPVRCVEHADDRAPALPLEGREEHLLPLPIDVVALAQEDVVARHALVQRPRVFCEAERGIRADALREIRRVERRVRNRHRRLFGIDVDGRQVEREMLVHLGDEQPRQAMDVDGGRRVELQFHPGAQPSRLELQLGSIDADVHAAARAIDPDAQRRGHGGRALAKHVLGPGNRELELVAAGGHGHPKPAFGELFSGRARREQQERPLRAQQVRHAHRAQLRAVEAIGRKGHRHPQHRAPDPVVAENAPERARFPKQPHVRFSSGNAVAADVKEPIDRADSHGGQPRQIGARIRLDEIENAVAAGIAPGAERRPRHRRYRRKRRAEPPIGAGVRQLLEIRQQAFAQKAVRQPGVLSVEAHDDQPRDRGARALDRRHPPQRPKRPRQQRQGDDEDRREENEERREKRKTGAGADVRVGAGGQREQPREGEHGDQQPGSG